MFMVTEMLKIVWSSIYIQDILKAELRYQFNLIRLINIITPFLYQICLADKSDGNNYLYVYITEAY